MKIKYKKIKISIANINSNNSRNQIKGQKLITTYNNIWQV